MFRWNLMLRTLFASCRQQSKARRLQTAVKPQVEELTPRILPSASSLPVVTVASPPVVPQVAAITSFVDSMVEQRLQLIDTIVQDASNIWNTLGQEIVQEVTTLQLQLGRILGINPNTSNPSSNAALSQPSSDRGAAQGHGSGSGAMTTAHDDPHPRLEKAVPLTDSGSGSGDSPDGYSGSATVYGPVWLDNNGDGSQDQANEEMDYAGATVDLLRSTDNGAHWSVIASTTTSGAKYGTNYSIQVGFPVPNSYLYQIEVVFPQYFAATIPSAQSQINAQGYSQVFSLAPGTMQFIPAGLVSMNVNTLGDDPNGPTQQNTVTLRDAILTGDSPNLPLPFPAVTFVQNPQTGQKLSGTIALQATLPAITKSYNVDGPGASTLAVSGNNSYGLFTVGGGVTSSISGLTIEYGYASYGGGVYNSGTLTLANDTIANNDPVNGGGIFNSKGKLNVISDDVNNNTATGLGGGLYNGGGGMVTISASEFYNNRANSGGGITNAGGGATLDIKNDTTIDYNIATAFGGGVYNTSGKVMMTGGSIYENSSSSGGGIYTVGGNVSLTYVYLYANFAKTGSGGGIFDDGNVLLKGGTVQGNTAKIGEGGGIYLLSGTLTLAAGGAGDVLIGGGNTAKTGGGLYLNSGTTNFMGCDVGGNTATVKAAGVAYTTNAKLVPKPPIPPASLTDDDDPGKQPVPV